jgi:hypothetical protein
MLTSLCRLHGYLKHLPRSSTFTFLLGPYGNFLLAREAFRELAGTVVSLKGRDMDATAQASTQGDAQTVEQTVDRQNLGGLVVPLTNNLDCLRCMATSGRAT